MTFTLGQAIADSSSGTASDPPQPAAPASSPALPPGLPTYTPPPSVVKPEDAGPLLQRNLMTGDWGGFRKTLQDDGLQVSPTYYGEVFGNPSGGAARGATYDGLFDVELDFDLAKMTGGAVDDLTFHANALYLHGAGLSQHFIGDFSITSNIAGYNSVRLQELWLQKGFLDHRLTIKIGNIAVDTEFFQSSTAALFINSTFGGFTLIGNNVPNDPTYPTASPGVRIEYLPASRFYLMAGVFGMDDKSRLDVENKYGTDFALDADSGMLVLSEVGFLLNQGPNDKGLPGTYRLGSFVHTANYDNWGSQAHNALGTGSLQGAGANYGIYGIMDQQLYTHGDEAISFFVRSGGAPSNINFVDWYVDGGFNFTGFIPGRKADIAGLAIARSHVSSNFSDSQILQGNAPFTAETVLDATYQIQLAHWWSLQPDFQYIVTPGGEQGAHNATVLGLRTTVAF